MPNSINKIAGAFLVVLLLGTAGCTQRVYYQARDGFKPDLSSYYMQTHTYRNPETGLQFSACHKQALYKKTF
ncbi:MAG: hypothetical protein ACPF9D_12930, partial [Owenweeksia sp.]